MDLYKDITAHAEPSNNTDYIINEDNEFWYVMTVGKKDPREEYKFDYVKFVKFLQDNGYHKYEEQDLSGELEFIRKQKNVLTKVKYCHILDFIFHVAENEDLEVYKMLIASNNRYASENVCKRIKYIKPKLMRNTDKSQLLFFKDHAWKVTKDGIEVTPYEQIPGEIWSTKIKDFNPSIEENYFTIDKDKSGKHTINFNIEKKFDFFTFLQRTSDIVWKKREVKQEVSKEEQAACDQILMSKLTAIGYLLHNYFDPDRSWAVIGNDHDEVEVGKAEGGTGKSLIGEFCAHLLNTVKISGRRKNLLDDSFLFDEVTRETDQLFFDDIRMSFDFDWLFPILTGILTVNAKNQRVKTIPQEDVPKVYLSTNYSVKCSTSSQRRRQWNIAFSNYYNDKRKPKAEFGKNFFLDWEEKEWNQYYNFAANCIQAYLQYGKIETPDDNLSKRRQ